MFALDGFMAPRGKMKRDFVAELAGKQRGDEVREVEAGGLCVVGQGGLGG